MLSSTAPGRGEAGLADAMDARLRRAGDVDVQDDTGRDLAQREQDFPGHVRR